MITIDTDLVKEDPKNYTTDYTGVIISKDGDEITDVVRIRGTEQKDDARDTLYSYEMKSDNIFSVLLPGKPEEGAFNRLKHMVRNSNEPARSKLVRQYLSFLDIDDLKRSSKFIGSVL